MLRVGGTKFALPCLDPLALHVSAARRLATSGLSGTGTSTGTFDLATCSSAASFFFLCFAQPSKSDSVVPEFKLGFAKLDVIPFRPGSFTHSLHLSHPEQTGLDLPYQDRTAFLGAQAQGCCIAYDTIRFPHVAIRSSPCASLSHPAPEYHIGGGTLAKPTQRACLPSGAQSFIFSPSLLLIFFFSLHFLREATFFCRSLFIAFPHPAFFEIPSGLSWTWPSWLAEAIEP